MLIKKVKFIARFFACIAILNTLQPPPAKSPKKAKLDVLINKIKKKFTEIESSVRFDSDDYMTLDHVKDVLLGDKKRMLLTFFMALFCLNCFGQGLNSELMASIYKAANNTVFNEQEIKFLSMLGPLFTPFETARESLYAAADSSVDWIRDTCCPRPIGHRNEFLASKTFTGAFNAFNAAWSIHSGSWMNVGYCFFFEQYIMPCYKNLGYKNKSKVLDMLTKKRSFYHEYGKYEIMYAMVHLYDYYTYNLLEHSLDMWKKLCFVIRLLRYFCSPLEFKEMPAGLGNKQIMLDKIQDDKCCLIAGHTPLWLISLPLMIFLWRRYEKTATREIRYQQTVYDMLEGALDNIDLVQHSSREDLETALSQMRWHDKTHKLDIVNNPLTRYTWLLGGALVFSVACLHKFQLHTLKFQSMAVSAILHAWLFQDLLGFKNQFFNTRFVWQDLKKAVKIMNAPNRPSNPNAVDFMPYEDTPGQIEFKIKKPGFAYENKEAPLEIIDYVDTK